MERTQEASGLEQLHSLPVAKAWQLKVSMVGKLVDLKADLDQGFGVAVSDGSFCNGNIRVCDYANGD